MRLRARFVLTIFLLTGGYGLHFPLSAAGPGPEAATERAWRENNIGVALMEQFDPAGAAEGFRRALALDPKLTVARANLAIAFLYAPDLPNARKEAEQALAEAPTMPQIHYVLALVARLENRPADAEKSLAALLAIDPRDAGANITLGQVLIDQERYADAIPHLEAAIAAEPHNASAYYNLAMALGRGGRMEEGKKMMARFQEVRKNPSHVTFGKGYMEQGRYAEAVVSTGLEAGLVSPGVPDVRFVDGSATLLGKVSVSAAVTGIHLADVNADGRLDAILATASGLRLLFNAPSGFEDVTAPMGLSGVTAIAAVAADVDNDGNPDIVVLGKDRLQLFHNDGSHMVDVSAKAGFPTPPSGASALALVDFDHDGDLDIFIPGLLLRNNGDGTFLETTKDAGLALSSGALAVAPTDFDNRRDVDLAVVSSDAVRLFQNNRDGSFTDAAEKTGLSPTGPFSALAVGDVNKDGFPDFAFGRPNGTALLAESDGRGRYSVRPLPEATARAHALLFVDYDADGVLDLVAAGPSGLRILRNSGGTYLDAATTAVPAPLRTKGPAGARLVIADLDGDGDADLLLGGADGLHAFRNEGIGPNQSFTVRIAARVSNRSGVGSKVEIRAGSLRQKAETSATTPAVAPADLVFGLGKRSAPDVVRVLWVSGILQAEVVDSAKAATTRPASLSVAELDRKPSSCPYLYAWNGERFEFITDFLGGGEMGYWVAPGVRNVPDPTEYVRIRSDQLRPRDGRLELRVTNELEEVLYLDHFKLMVLDHPKGLEVFPDEGMTEVPKDFRLYAVRDLRPVPSAVAADGSDATARLARLDHSFAEGLPLLPVRGYAKAHSLTLNLAGLPKSHTLLILTGWTDYAFSSDNVAASQQGLVEKAPELEVENEFGQWEPAIADIGVPVGRPQSIVVDLAGKWKGTSRRIRITTSMRVYWDSVAVGSPASVADVRTTELEPASAILRERGFSKETSPDGREPWSYDYASVSRLSPWKSAAGRYTRTGDVAELLARSDDMFVVSKPGDEVALSFDATRLHPVPEGWTRTYLLLGDGYSKEMDINSASPDVVMPLPYHGMKAYPYDVAAAPAEVRKLAEQAEAWNTRFIPRSVEPIEAALARR